MDALQIIGTRDSLHGLELDNVMAIVDCGTVVELGAYSACGLRNSSVRSTVRSEFATMRGGWLVAQKFCTKVRDHLATF